MPPLISQLLPLEKNECFNSLLKLSNDQLLSLIQSYSTSNHSIKVIVKNNRLDSINLEGKTYKISNLKESNIELYASLNSNNINSDTNENDGNRCVGLGSLNYRSNIMNFKPPLNPNSLIITDEQTIRTNHLKIQVLEYLSSQLEFNSSLEVDLDSLRRHFHKIPLTKIKAIYDEITIPKTKNLNTEQLLLIKNQMKNKQLENYMTSLGYIESDPIRLMITNNISQLKLKSKSYQESNSDLSATPSSSKSNGIKENSKLNNLHSSTTIISEIKQKSELKREIVVPIVKKLVKKKPLNASPAAYPQLKPIKHTRKLSSSTLSAVSTPELKPIAPQSSKKTTSTTTSPKKIKSNNNESKSSSLSSTSTSSSSSSFLSSPKNDFSHSSALVPALKPISGKHGVSSSSSSTSTSTSTRPTLVDTSNLRKLSKHSKNVSPVKKRPISNGNEYATISSGSNSGSDEDFQTATVNNKKSEENNLTSPRKKRRTVSEVSSASTSSVSSVTSGSGKKGSPLTSYSEDEGGDESIKLINNKQPINNMTSTQSRQTNYNTTPLQSTTNKKPLPTQPKLASPSIPSIPKSPRSSLSNNTSKVSSPKFSITNVSSPKMPANLPKGPINLPRGPKAMGTTSSSSTPTPTPTSTSSIQQMKSPMDSLNSGNSTPRSTNLNHGSFSHNNDNRQQKLEQPQEHQLTQSEVIDLSLRYHNLYKVYSELYSKIENGHTGPNDDNGELDQFVKLNNELSWIRWKLDSVK